MKLIAKIKKNEFWDSVVKLSTGQLIAQFITLAATLVLSRIYTDADYGTYGIITSTAAIIMSFVSLALGSAIMVVETDEDSRRVFTVAAFAQIILTAIVLVVMVAMMPVKRFFDTSIPYVVALALIGIHIVLNILYTMTSVYINRLKLNNVLFWNSLINAGSTVFISIPLGLLGCGFVGLLIASIVAEFLCFLQMAMKATPFKQIRSFDEIKKTFIDCKKFIFFQYPANLMGTLANNTPNQALYSMYGDAALGSYAMCSKVFNLPLNLIVTPIQTVYFRTAAQMKNRKEELSDFTYDFLKKMMLIAAIPIILCMSFGEYIFGFVLGWQWMEAGRIAAIMCPYFLFWFCYNCVTYLRVAIGFQKVNLLTTAVQMLCLLGALGASVLIDGNLIVTVCVFAIVNAIISWANILVSFICLKKNAWKYTVTSLTYVLVCGCIVFGIRAMCGTI